MRRIAVDASRRSYRSPYIAGLEVGVDVRGTINRTGDRDETWTIELALPWAILREASPGHRAPRDGEQWRINFSRVQWTTDVRDKTYVKRLDPAAGPPLAEDNWVWSPQGIRHARAGALGDGAVLERAGGRRRDPLHKRPE